MAMQFFNFGNEETFHFFMWVTEGGAVKVEELIKKAMDQVETDNWFAMGMDVSSVCRDKLADILSELLREVTGYDLENDAREYGHVDDRVESLTEPIFCNAIGRISCSTVAEALLIRAGKWAPDREIPELE